ncbi:squalene-hopene cyclase-like protein [Aquimarina sp. MAR_2010_214]|uniref:prenyltransferase/squalene oxidase repeat-containing protein n=1 Tax=Aquimarina sp. MAR_2010_214 TaxID=1250026 RepID=UPI000C704FE0|nr:prenyltransferase/squalene oxidase repeat-containing protein [Aquimarina sp. MAR_2010_214]PKV50632.1 squalene-hopene cyclase-like protein [Aquimarina sp. MAR_2010_214]
MSNQANIKTIIDQKDNNIGKFWSREDGDIHAPHGSSTMDTLTVLGELGATTKEYPILFEAIDFVLRYQTEDGAFRYSKTSSKLPCMTARILAAFGRLGAHTDKRMEKSYQRLLDIQWSDGGWRCNTVKLGKSPDTDASNPGTTLYVLDAFRFRNNSKKEYDQLDKGIEFLLKHWTIRRPMGPCTFGIGSRFFQVEYPFLRYNLFYYVYVLSFYDKAKQDDRFKEAYTALLAKTENGKILPENPHRTWRRFDFAKKGEVSHLASKRWKEIETNVVAKNIDD